MKQLFFVFAITAVLFSACTGSSTKQNGQTIADTDHQHDMKMDSGTVHQMDNPEMKVQESKTTSMVITDYLKIKNSLVADDDKGAALAGKDLVSDFDHFDNSSIPADKISDLKQIIEDARENADHISENKGNIEHQREHFEMLGSDIKDLIKIAGTDRTLYQIYCPMYNNKKGGSWLSASNEIKNPLLGSKMESCGEVKSKISIQ